MLAAVPSVALFVELAAAAEPSFKLTEGNASAVAELCARLDGLPLGLELAAARVRALPPEAIVARLDSAPHLLTGARDAPHRQRTLHATVAWNYDLLDDQEQMLFRRLSVFAGGCTLEAAEAICGGDMANVLEALVSLIDKSLLRQAIDANGEPRFRLLATVREYAAERLDASGETESLRRQHAEHFLAIAEQANPELRSASQMQSAAWLERDHDNLRSALRWFVERGQAEQGLRLGTALWPFWWMHGHLQEGRERLADVLALAAARANSRELMVARAAALNGAGVLTHQQGDRAMARSLFEESLALSRKVGDQRGIAASLQSLGNAAGAQRQYPLAQSLYEEALVIRRNLGDQYDVASLLNTLGMVATELGDSQLAGLRLNESLAIARALGDRQTIASVLCTLANVARHQGDCTLAGSLVDKSLAIWRELGLPMVGVAAALNTLGN
jgi:tetratricopeptide (TPR) repeat protein